MREVEEGRPGVLGAEQMWEVRETAGVEASNAHQVHFHLESWTPGCQCALYLRIVVAQMYALNK